MEWQVRWAGGLTYEVSHKNRMIIERFVVDLLAETCSCRFWRLCGMPCPHACCAIFEKGDNPEDYCNNFYSPAAYATTYEPEVVAAANEEDPAAVDTTPTANNRSGVNIHRYERIRQVGIGRGRRRGRAASSQPLPTTPVAASSQPLPTTPTHLLDLHNKPYLLKGQPPSLSYLWQLQVCINHLEHLLNLYQRQRCEEEWAAKVRSEETNR
ncbi:hypothetical protein Ahy_B10g105588 [Arachis hypogaea]|uniref:SWIM-type domain-containing protein n=1 Tax=Arachis hypogaea TaxID=3818 RepID=A0A444X8E6_ARAHY|nr:hypothetical protein Ahy_B10g105588 [Arachis hypogaea]